MVEPLCYESFQHAHVGTAETVIEHIDRMRPCAVVVDSIQTLRTDRVESAPGSVAQVRECAALLASTAKTHGTALVHAGSNTLFYAVVWIAPSENLIFVAATNRGGDSAENATNQVITALAKKYASQ